MARSRTKVDPLLESQHLTAELREAVASGRQHWFAAVLAAIRQWSLAEEQVDGRRYRYLIGGEAFDWLLLAERLCEELKGVVPQEECEALLFHGCLPLELSEEEFRRLIGPAKYRAHLNFVYGVRVEEALQLAVEEEVHKERLTRVWENGHVDDEACRRVYGASRGELLAACRQERDLPPIDRLSLCELKEFTYWLFKHRLRNADPARMASDTRKGLARLAQLEARRRQVS